MFFEIIFFLFIGILFGTLTGLVPGLHPNMIILIVPLLVGFGLETEILLSLIVAMAVSNSIIYFISSIVFGIPDSGSELSVLPGHELIMKGQGYHAVKLTVIGAIGSIIVSIIILPIVIFSVPFIYNNISSFIYILLILIVLFMIFSEKKKILAFIIFTFSGFIGIFSQKLPIDNSLILFPIFSGLFGLSMIFLQLGKKVKIPKQKPKKYIFVSNRLTNRAILSGSFSGVVAGFLPSIGTSEITSLLSLDKNKYSFLVSIGSITTSNIILSILALFLIGRARSGVAVSIEQFMNIGINEVILIILFSVISVGLGSFVTLFLAREILEKINKINYSKISLFIFLFILIMVYIFTNIHGLFLGILCTLLGIATNLSNVKRGLLMGVLIVPTILFYLPFY